jgi:hypothetical protein
MNLEELEKRLRTLEDIKEIENLQRKYGYYLEHWMAEEIIDLFADSPDAALEFPDGKYLGKKGVKRYFEDMEQRLGSPEFLHQLMQLCPVISIDPNGKTAHGRWYSFGGLALPLGGGVSQYFLSGTYENEYIKEGGKWKILRLRWYNNFEATPEKGWVAPERVAARDPNSVLQEPPPDAPSTRKGLNYPSGYIFPFHYKHPITGKKTTEEQRNASRGIKDK